VSGKSHLQAKFSDVASILLAASEPLAEQNKSPSDEGTDESVKSWVNFCHGMIGIVVGWSIMTLVYLRWPNLWPNSMFGTKSSVQRQSQSTAYVPIRLTLPTPALLVQKQSRAECPLRCMVPHPRPPNAGARPSCMRRNAHHHPKGNEAWERRQGQTGQSGGPGCGPALCTLTQGKRGISVMRSVWSASSMLAPSLNVAPPKAGASSTHSKRFAPRNVRAVQQGVTGPTCQSTKPYPFSWKWGARPPRALLSGALAG